MKHVRIGSRYERPWHETRGSDGSYSAKFAPATAGDLRVQSALLARPTNRRRKPAILGALVGLVLGAIWLAVLGR